MLKELFLSVCHQLLISTVSIEGKLTTPGHPLWRQVSDPLAQSASGLGANVSTTLAENLLRHH